METGTQAAASPHPNKPLGALLSDPLLQGVTCNKQQPYDTLHSLTADPEKAPPMMQQFLGVKAHYPGVLLLYQMGDFYETFFEDALITAKALELTLTGREAGGLGRIPMAGVPLRAAENYLQRLISQNFKVAICDQVEDPATVTGKNLVQRRVTRILSSGTLTESNFLTPGENNYLAAVIFGKNNLCDYAALAWCDVSTGGVWVTTLPAQLLNAELTRIQPSELLTPGCMQRKLPGQVVAELIADVPPWVTSQFRCTAMADQAFRLEQATTRLQEKLNVATLSGFGLETTHPLDQLAIQAAGAIVQYLQDTLLDTPIHFDGLQRCYLDHTLTLNASSRRHLELLSTVKEGRTEGTLFWVLNQTLTPMGTRLLRQWVGQPLREKNQIQDRLDAVEALVHAARVRLPLREVLPQVYDLERLSIRVANLTASPRDLAALKQSLTQLPTLSSLLSGLTGKAFQPLQTLSDDIFKMSGAISAAIEESPPLQIKEGGVIRTGYHAELDRIRELVSGHVAWLTDFEARERERTGIKTLKVAFNNAFGYYIEMSKASAVAAGDNLPPDYHRKQTLTNAERFTTPELKTFEAEVMDAQARQYDLEYELFVAFRIQLLQWVDALKQVAKAVASLDALQSLATVATESQYTKPIIDDSSTLEIQGGRHPVVEKLVPMGAFVSNPCAVAGGNTVSNDPQALLITGPNMAGKSTYMRQVALIVLMAQMGSFVPASFAHIGLCDAIYTRVGAVDDLAAGQSTFMVEMTETAQILNNATEKSLVILDEIGRGTSTYDGVAIAWSVLEYLVTILRPRTLFATHYHELNVLADQYPGQVQNVRVCVSEEADGSGDIIFLHTVEPGAAQKSYGIQVAKMAGVPLEVVNKANTRLNAMQKKADTLLANRRKDDDTLLGVEVQPQLTLF